MMIKATYQVSWLQPCDLFHAEDANIDTGQKTRLVQPANYVKKPTNEALTSRTVKKTIGPQNNPQYSIVSCG